MVKAQAKVPSLTWPARILPTIVIAGRYPLQDRHFHPIYRTYDVHAMHQYEYRGRMRFDQREIEIQPGDVTLSPAMKPTSYDLPEPGHHLVIHFSVDCKSQATERTVNLPLHIRLGAHRDIVTQKLLAITRWHNLTNAHPINEAAASAAFQELLLWLVMFPNMIQSGNGDSSGHAVEQAAALIERQIDQPFSVPLLAQQVGLSQNYLARCFRQRFGVSMQRYLIKRRIDVAQHLLASTNLSIGQIAARVGMPNPQHFNKQFRHIAGMSPSRVVMGVRSQMQEQPV